MVVIPRQTRKSVLPTYWKDMFTKPPPKLVTIRMTFVADGLMMAAKTAETSEESA